MALIDFDGFETGTVLAPNTSIGASLTAQLGRDGVGVRLAGSSSQATLSKAITSGSDTIYFHIGRLLASASEAGSTSAGAIIFGVQADTATVNHLTLNVDATGHLTLRRGTSSGTIIATSSLTLPLSGNYWLSVEAKVTIHDTTGECIVKINGVEWINFTGDTRNAGTSTRPDSIMLGTGVVVAGGTDDWLCNDTTGATNNSWPGEVSIVGARPAGNGANNGLMGSDANQVNNYQQVDDANPYNTTDYNGSVTVGAKDSYDMTAVGKTGTVLAVQQLTYAAKSDAGAKSFKHLARSSGGTEVLSAAATLSTTYVLYAGPIWLTDPTGAAWTVSNVDSAEFGFQVET